MAKPPLDPRQAETIDGRIELNADDGLVIDLARGFKLPHDPLGIA